MAQYLDLNGLRTIVDNVKKIKFPVCLPIYNNTKILSIGATIKNDSAPSYTSIIYDVGSACFLAQYNSTTYYTKWKADNTHMSSDNYGTTTTRGVQPKAGYLYVHLSDNTLQVCFDGKKLINVPSPTWTTVTASPIAGGDLVTKMERSDTGNGTYLWRITVKNPNADACQFLVQTVEGDNFIQYGIYLGGKQSGTFTIELPKTTPNDIFYITL